MTIVSVLAASAIFAAPVALGSSPQDTARQYARGDRQVSSARLQAAMKNPTVQAYQGPGQQGQMQQQAVAGAEKTLRNAAPAAAGQAGTLPFTGLELTLFVVVGIALLGGGLLIRRLGRSSE